MFSLTDQKEQKEINELWKNLQDLSDKEKITKAAKELMMTDPSLLRQKENNIELLIVRLNVDEEEIRNKSKSIKLLQERPPAEY